MPEYEIKCVVKDEDGDITRIGYYKPEKDTVYVIPRETAIAGIESGETSYYTFNEQKTKVNVYAKDFLRSTADETTYNNLDSLRPCKS